MKAITFAAPIPRYLATLAAGKLSDSLYVGAHACTRFGTVDTPALPNDQWVRVRTTLGGICGSDLAIIGLQTSPSTSPFSTFPFVLGHENVGVISEAGRGVRGFSVGERVTVNPLLCCEPRAVSPVCASCAVGHHSRCTCFTDGVIPAGTLIGTTRSVGGSWGEEFVAHHSQLVRVPESLADEDAVLTEPFACCVHAVRNSMPNASDRCLVIGAGTMGLLTTTAIHALAPKAETTILARHQFQGEHAKRLGATSVVFARGDYIAELADAAHTRLLQPIIGRPIGVGGFDMTFVCASNSRSVEDALRYTRSGGRIVLLGNASTLRGVDWSPLWLKEIQITGSLAYGAHGHGAASLNAFDEAAQLIASGGAKVKDLVTHVFPLGEYRSALAAARARGGERSVKVVLRP